MELRGRVVAFVEEGNGQAFPGFTKVRQRHGEAET